MAMKQPMAYHEMTFMVHKFHGGDLTFHGKVMGILWITVLLW